MCSPLNTNDFINDKLYKLYASTEDFLSSNFLHSSEYNFFSDDVNSMIQYSSNWFLAEPLPEPAKEETVQEDDSGGVIWFSQKKELYYDVGYAEQIALFPEKKEFAEEVKEVMNERTIQAYPGIEIRRKEVPWCSQEPARPSPCFKSSISIFPSAPTPFEKAQILVEPEILEKNSEKAIEIRRIKLKKENSLEKRRSPRIAASGTLKNTDTDCNNKIKEKKPLEKDDKFMLNKKIATSRFGRTRIVLDFSDLIE